MVTIAERALFSRRAGSSTPTVTVSRTRSRAPAIGTGSASASVARFTALSGPTISTRAGSDVIEPTMYPGAGRPSTESSTGTVRVADGSNANAMADGVTCTISTPNGARTCSGVSGNNR